MNFKLYIIGNKISAPYVDFSSRSREECEVKLTQLGDDYYIYEEEECEERWNGDPQYRLTLGAILHLKKTGSQREARRAKERFANWSKQRGPKWKGHKDSPVWTNGKVAMYTDDGNKWGSPEGLHPTRAVVRFRKGQEPILLWLQEMHWPW